MSGKEYRIKITDENNPAISYISEPIEVLTPESACVDDRDGKIYKVVKIGDAYWFADNLEYDNPDYDNGRYNYKYSSSPLCPSGWHEPSLNEWYDLFIAAGMQDSYRGVKNGYIESGNVGKKLKATVGWPDGGNGEDTFEFNAQYGQSSWWTDTYRAFSSDYCYYYNITISTENGIYINNNRNDETQHNVRCIKD